MDENQWRKKMTKDEQKEIEKAEIIFHKKISYNDALIRAWLKTKLEKDKSIMSVSLITILVHVANIFCNGIGNDFEKFVCAFSISLLATSVLTTIFIYEKNAELIECLWFESTRIVSLKIYDLINLVCFISGTSITILFFLLKIIYS